MWFPVARLVLFVCVAILSIFVVSLELPLAPSTGVIAFMAAAAFASWMWSTYPGDGVDGP